MISPDLQAYLAAKFSAPAVQGGTAYAAAGRAVIRRITRNGRTIRTEGRCRCSQFFDVDLRLEIDQRNRVTALEGACTCGIGAGCQHVVAMLLALYESDIPLPFLGKPLSGPVTMMSDPQALAWLDALDGKPAAPPAAAAITQCIVYLLHPGEPARLTVGKSRMLKRGGLGKPTAFHPQSYDLPGPGSYRRSLFQDADTVPLRLFISLGAVGPYGSRGEVELAGEEGALLLKKALATGRLFVVGQAPELALDCPVRLAAPRALALKWDHDASGRQRLVLDLPAGITAIRTWPMYALDGTTGDLAELRSELPDQLLLGLLKAPPLNELDAPLARRRLERLAGDKALALPLPEAPPTLDAGEPSARLTLTRGRFRHHGAHAIDDFALAELRFDYPDGLSVAGTEDPVPMLRHQRADGQWQVLARNVPAEEAVWRRLRELGLDTYPRRLPGYVRLDHADEGLMPAQPNAAAWMPLLEDGLAELADAGIAVTIADDFPYQLAEADDWFVELDEAVGSDWFDLDLGVMVGGERISLVPPLLRLVREHPQLLATVRALADTQAYPVALDERRILPVPAGRLKAWLLPLLEFLDDDRPRLARHHAAALADLEGSATQCIGGAELRALGQRLRDFSGIASVPPAEGFGTTLRGYQQAGLDWLQFLREFGLAGILADDMGLGKTVQTLAHLHLEKAAGRADRPSLVIAPTSLLGNWRSEAAQFTPGLKVLTLHGPDRAMRFDEIAAADLIVTTYPLLVRDRAVLLEQEFHLLVMDEAQFIKNPKAQSHQVARQLKARHRLSLTGTPLENHLGELWAQFDFLMPGLLGTNQRFGRLFRAPIEKQNDGDARALLAERVRPFLLRRTKEQVLKELPPRTEMVRWVELESGQRDLYESLRVAFDKRLRQVLAEQGVGRSQIMILDALLKLRQVCCDPRLVKLPAAEKIGKGGLRTSAKLAVLIELIEELLSEGRRILLFSQFTSMLELIEQELSRCGIPFVQLTGQTRDRDTPIREFQEGRVPLFLISLKAGGTGLNLTAADTVIHYDPWWNPAVEEQATARAHRIGQDKPVFVYKLLTVGTVEEKIRALQDRKRGLADQLIKGGEEGSGHLLTAADLEVLFQPLPPG